MSRPARPSTKFGCCSSVSTIAPSALMGDSANNASSVNGATRAPHPVEENHSMGCHTAEA